MAAVKEGRRNAELNRLVFSMGRLVGGGHLAEQLVRNRLSAAARKAGLDDDEIEPTVHSGLIAGKKQPRAPILVLSAKDHTEHARAFRNMQRPHIRRYRSEFFDWHGGRYRPVAQDDLVADVHLFLDQAHKATNKGSEPFMPNRAAVAETISALAAVTNLDSYRDPPFWLDGSRVRTY